MRDVVTVDMANRGMQSIFMVVAIVVVMVAGALFLAMPVIAGAATPARMAQDDPPVTLRLLTYNIKHGLGNDGEIDLERTAAVINALQPDLVALQEVDNGVERTGGVDQAQRLGQLTGMHAAFGDFMEYQGGHYGMAILSRYPIVESENHRLPDGAEPRSALAARVKVDDTGREIVFVGIHLYRTAEERLCQAKGSLWVTWVSSVIWLSMLKKCPKSCSSSVITSPTNTRARPCNTQLRTGDWMSEVLSQIEASYFI